MKILYFEGAGWSGADISKATIGNCRIRTAFRLDDGRRVYLELTGSERSKRTPKWLYTWQYTGFVDHAFFITDDNPNNDCNNHRINIDKHQDNPTSCTFEWSLPAILELVNSLGASFDAVQVVPDLGGYRVFKSNPKDYGTGYYNYGDEFTLDAETVRRREMVHDDVYRVEVEERKADRETHGNRIVHGGSDFPNFSLWVDEQDKDMLHILRHFNGYNKHWTIRTDAGCELAEIMATMEERISSIKPPQG